MGKIKNPKIGLKNSKSPFDLGLRLEHLPPVRA